MVTILPLHKNPLSKLEGYSYYITLFVLFVVVFSITRYFQLDKFFYLLYQVNYSNINSSIITIFGTLFAFVFAILAILFSLKEDSYFVKLINESRRNKKDIINYFIWTIVSVALVVILSFFLTITFTTSTVSNPELNNFLSNITQTNEVLIYLLLYIFEIAILNVLLLLATFVTIIKKD